MVNPYLLERQRNMEANAACMQKILGKNAVASGVEKEDLMQVARNLVYGGAEKGTMANKARTEHTEIDADPAYEPDAAEIANADDDLLIDEEETSLANHSSKVIKYISVPFYTP